MSNLQRDASLKNPHSCSFEVGQLVISYGIFNISAACMARYISIDLEKAMKEMFDKGDENAIEKAAFPVLLNIMQAMEENDYKKYCRDLEPEMARAVPESKFKETYDFISANIGKYRDSSYLGHLKKREYYHMLWKGHFEKAGEEVLITMICKIIDDKLAISGIWYK